MLIKQGSFRLHLSLVLVSLTLLVSGVSLFYLNNQQSNFLKSNLEQQGHAITTLVAADIAKLVYLNDPDTAANITQRLQDIPEVYAAYFFDQEYKPILTIRNGSNNTPEHSTGINTSIAYQGVALGHAHFVFYSPSLNAQFSDTKQRFLLIALVMALMSLLIILYIDKHFMIRLSELSQALKNATVNKDFSTTLTNLKHDEIGQAREHFNQLIHMVKQKTDDLKFKANHDSLTGLYSRHLLLQEIEDSLDDDEQQHALCYLDLDQFKVINDTCGHVAGDSFLQALSQIMKQFVVQHPNCLLGRIGGDEFILLVKDRDQQAVMEIAQQLHNAICDFHFRFQERTFLVGASIGIITYGQSDASAQEILGAADAACYLAKNQGRDNILIYDLHDPELAKEQKMISWVSRLYDALESNRFELYFQPIVPLDSFDGSFHHYETLLRLNCKGKTIAPALFIPVAERYGLSKKIDLWVIEHLCKQLSEEFLNNTSLVTINLSADTLMDARLIGRISQIIENADVPFDKLCFEITETGMISNLNQVQDFIAYFTAKGVKFALDDFGSGMSSFGYLSQLPVSYLKIDGGFVKDIVENPVMREMVASMNRIGQLTDKQVVAEFIETPEAIEVLKEIGVNYGQGYYFSRPRPIADFMELMDTEAPQIAS